MVVAPVVWVGGEKHSCNKKGPHCASVVQPCCNLIQAGLKTGLENSQIGSSKPGVCVFALLGKLIADSLLSAAPDRPAGVNHAQTNAFCRQ